MFVPRVDKSDKGKKDDGCRSECHVRVYFSFLKFDVFSVRLEPMNEEVSNLMAVLIVNFLFSFVEMKSIYPTGIFHD